MTARVCSAVVGFMALVVVTPHAQTFPAARVAILQAEIRGARDARDLATLRAGARNGNGETARAAIRALGRLGRPALVADIAVALKSAVPELRAEAADAMAAALSGAARLESVSGGKPASRRSPAEPSVGSAVATTLSMLLSRLAVEAEPGVRAAICEALGRIPYSDTGQITRAESALLGVSRGDAVTDRLGVVKGLESLVRLNAGRWTPGAPAVSLLRTLLGVADAPADASGGAEASPAPVSIVGAPQLRDARVRRLALDALLAAGAVDGVVMGRSAVDPDAQVRRLAMRAAGVAAGSGAAAAASTLQIGRIDAHPQVRSEALRAEGLLGKGTSESCRHFMEGARDRETQVVLVALDLLTDCGAFDEAVTLLEQTAGDLSAAAAPRGWHRPAHALVALSRAVPDRAAAIVGRFTASLVWPLRAYAARSASILHDRDTLLKLASDPIDRVRQIADEGLGRPVTAVSAGAVSPVESDISAADLQRFAASRARVSIRGVGMFDVALFTSEAPATVLRFVRLAQAGRYDGTTVLEVLPTRLGLIPHADTAGLIHEVGSWPHVRGAMGLWSGDAETAGAGIFIDLIDNPRFDHQYPVFAQVLNGIEVLDQILEGDVIERVEILSGP